MIGGAAINVAAITAAATPIAEPVVQFTFHIAPQCRKADARSLSDRGGRCNASRAVTDSIRDSEELPADVCGGARPRAKPYKIHTY